MKVRIPNLDHSPRFTAQAATPAGRSAPAMASTANQYGSLIFCSRCGTLLDLPGDEDHLVCDGCGQVEDATGELQDRLLSILRSRLTRYPHRQPMRMR